MTDDPKLPRNAPHTPEAASLLRLSMLGGLRIERLGAVPVSRFQTQKTAALLAYLTLFCGRTHGRELLTDLFWPDAAPDDGRRSFRNALSSLRRLLEPPGTPMGAVLVADRTSVRLNLSNIEIDVTRFAAACLAGPESTLTAEELRLDAALAWYGGPLLPGFYDDWIGSERARLADLYRDLLLRRAACAEVRGRLASALDFAYRAANLEQDRESSGTEEVYPPAHIAVIRLLARSGRPAEARRHYDLFRRRLQDLYEEVPSQEARAALAMLPDPAEHALDDNLPEDLSAVASPPPSEPRTAGFVRLPFTLTRFFGRGPEQARLAAAFADPHCRLITLTGPGGSGKTRLAVEWARQCGQTLPGTAICFVALADLTRANYLWLAVADALALDRLPDTAAIYAQVCTALNALATPYAAPGDRAGPLLVLDNFEAWVDEGAPLVERLLQAVPTLRLVVTSRRRLQIGGEHEIPVGPLPVPTRPGTPESLLEWPSIQLFVDRAQIARPDFQITAHNTRTIAELSRRLEGIPLALELTAAWAGALTTAQILERIDANLLDEAGPPRAYQRAQRPARHRTLRAAIETSFSLLPSDLQRAFACLSVFRGGWTLEAAQSVLSGASVSAADALSRLRERSLIIAETGADGDTLRFRLLATLQEFAAEALEETECEIVQDLHAAYFLRFAQAAVPQIGGAEAKTNLDVLEREHDNVRAALEFWLATPVQAERGLQLAGTMARFWNHRGFWEEGITWLNRGLDRTGELTARPEVRAQALLGKGQIAYQQGEFSAARTAYEEALAIRRLHGDETHIGTLLLCLAGIAFHADQDYERARIMIEECLTQCRRLGDRAGVAVALSGLGSIGEELGDNAGARTYFEECLELERALGNRGNQATALFSLGNIAYHEERWSEAQSCYEESLRLQTELGNPKCIGYSWQGLGNVATARGEYASAHSCYEEALKIARRLGEKWAVAILLNNQGKLAYHENDFSRARSLCCESLQMRFATRDEAGAARVLENLALIAARNSTKKRATTLWGAVYAARERLHIPAVEDPLEAREGPIAALRTALSAKVFDAAWAQGRALTFEEMIAYALE